MTTYSFQDTHATIAGPGGDIDLGAGSANAEEGITIEMAEDRNEMTMGADGEGMHSLRAAKHGTVTVRLLKTSSVNAKLTAMYNAQSLSSRLWGANVILIRSTRSGDTIAARGAAFQRMPNMTYARAGGTVEWQFHALKIDGQLGHY